MGVPGRDDPSGSSARTSRCAWITQLFDRVFERPYDPVENGQPPARPSLRNRGRNDVTKPGRQTDPFSNDAARGQAPQERDQRPEEH